MGTLWNKPAVTVYVRPTRFTHKFMNENEYFTVSFFPEDKREALTKMGTITGRHKTDKDALTGLTVRDLGEAVTYEEAEVTFLCRKIYSADMLTRHMPVDIVEAFYTPEEPHTLYIGEVIERHRLIVAMIHFICPLYLPVFWQDEDLQLMIEGTNGPAVESMII